MKFNLHHTTSVKGEQQQNTNVEIEYSLEELIQGQKHVIELLQHRQDISAMFNDIANIILGMLDKVSGIKAQAGLAQLQAAMQMQAAQMQGVAVEPVKPEAQIQNVDTTEVSYTPTEDDFKRMVSAW